jgi:hypothetical protein
MLKTIFFFFFDKVLNNKHIFDTVLDNNIHLSIFYWTTWI